jgi:hypothetical protein
VVQFVLGFLAAVAAGVLVLLDRLAGSLHAGRVGLSERQLVGRCW